MLSSSQAAAGGLKSGSTSGRAAHVSKFRSEIRRFSVCRSVQHASFRSRQERNAVTAAFRNSSIGADDATPPNAGPARRAAAGLLSAAATAALLAGPVDAAALQSVSPTAATQHAASMSLGGMTQGRQGEAHQASLSELPASAPQLQLQAPILLADLSLPRFEGLPRLDNPFQVLGFLLEHPVAALVVGGGLAIAIPRLVRLSVRFVVVPAVLALALYLAAKNPSFVWGALSGTASAVTAHPVATSAVILLGSSLLLSPYILLAGVALVLVTGTKILPGFMRPALPGPVNEALHQVDLLQGQTKSALEQLGAVIRPAPALKDGKK